MNTILQLSTLYTDPIPQTPPSLAPWALVPSGK